MKKDRDVGEVCLQRPLGRPKARDHCATPRADCPTPSDDRPFERSPKAPTAIAMDDLCGVDSETLRLLASSGC